MNEVPRKFGAKQGPGQSVLRKEDAAFATGHGRYTSDISVSECLVAHVVRSPVAAGSFSINAVSDARAAPGVHLVLTGEDVAALPDLMAQDTRPQPDGSRPPLKGIPILCRDEVRHVGDAVALIVADTLQHALDAAELLDIDWDMRDPVVATASALEEGAPVVWLDLGTNRAFVNQLGDRNGVDAAFAAADKVARIAFTNNRLVCNYMETRAAIADHNASSGQTTLTVGSQGVHGMRSTLKKVFGRTFDLRVITPDVGGGFGPKGFCYREYALIIEAARRLGRPVRWTGERTEHFLSDAQGRDNEVVAEMALDADGRFLALRARITAAMGAYLHQYGPMIPWFGVTMATGVYDIPVMDIEVTGVYTNTVPVDAYRGAGRPEAAFLIEKLADECARVAGITPDEIRRRNFIRPDQMPYTTTGGRMYDVGEFAAHMEEAMKDADWGGFEARRKAAAEKGLWRGIGMATYIEACAFAGSEPAYAVLNTDGTVTLDIGTQSNGQGHATAYAQFLSDSLDLPVDAINVRQGDTDWLARGGGTGGSRSIPLGGVSARQAGQQLAERIRAKAADMLEASAADIELIGGSASVVGTDRHVTFAEIAANAGPDMLRGEGDFVQAEATYPNGTHICEVEVDPATGVTEIVNYTIVDDFGFTVNPMLLEGQVHGGAAQGIGQALMEHTVYSEDGQLLTASFMDYAMPRADNIPGFSFRTRNVPSTTNAMGIKGAGEAGTIGSTPAVMNALADALHHGCGVSHVDMPATPLAVWQAIEAARK